MKQFQIKDVAVQTLPKEALENLFNVYKTSSGDYFYNIMRTVQIQGMENLDSGFFTGHLYKEGEQWSSISYSHYGTITLWWLVALVNGYTNPFSLPSAGTTLLIPRREAADQILSLLRGA